jgi:uncharacterized membrane protein YfcA
MISVPLYLLLIPYGAFLLAFLFFSLVNIVNLLRYGAQNAVGLTATFLFICCTTVILFLTWQALGTVDWTIMAPLLPAQAAAF